MKKLLLLSLLGFGSLWLSTDSQCKAKLTAFDPKYMQYDIKQSNQNASNASSTISTDTPQKNLALEVSGLSSWKVAAIISGVVATTLTCIAILTRIDNCCNHHVPQPEPVAIPQAVALIMELAEIVMDNMRHAAAVAAVDATANLNAAPAA